MTFLFGFIPYFLAFSLVMSAEVVHHRFFPFRGKMRVELAFHIPWKLIL